MEIRMSPSTRGLKKNKGKSDDGASVGPSNKKLKMSPDIAGTEPGDHSSGIHKDNDSPVNGPGKNHDSIINRNHGSTSRDAKVSYDPVLVVFVDNSSVMFYDGKEEAKNKFADSIRQICDGGTEELLRFKEFSDKLEQPSHRLSHAERFYADECNPTPALVKFKDGSAFAHYLGVEYMKDLMKSHYHPDELDLLQFEEDDDFGKIEKIAAGYNQIAIARCESPSDIESVKVAPGIFKKIVPTSTSP
jgi:hypothetical protein